MKNYKLIPLSEITDEARKIAVSWVEDFQDGGGLMIEQKHKLASDIMNYAQLKLSQDKVQWINVKDQLPKFSGEYNVVWNLGDNGYPTTTCMDWDLQKKIWTDPRCDGMASDNVLYWSELPEPPKNIPISIWHTEHKKDNMAYGECVHGNNLATCDICDLHS